MITDCQTCHTLPSCHASLGQRLRDQQLIGGMINLQTLHFQLGTQHESEVPDLVFRHGTRHEFEIAMKFQALFFAAWCTA